MTKKNMLDNAQSIQQWSIGKAIPARLKVRRYYKEIAREPGSYWSLAQPHYRYSIATAIELAEKLEAYADEMMEFAISLREHFSTDESSSDQMTQREDIKANEEKR